MNQLRQFMLEELQRRNFADTTIRTYLHGVAHFSRYFHRPPDQLGPEDIRKYQAMLFSNSGEQHVLTYLRRSDLEELQLTVNLSNTPFCGIVEAPSGNWSQISFPGFRND